MFGEFFSWNTLWWVLLVFYILACFGLIGIVLMQKGKGSGFAGAFGVGPGSETVFGPRARKSIPVRLTYICAGVFMMLSLGMSLVAGCSTRGSAPEKVAETETETGSTAIDALFEPTPGIETPMAPAATPQSSAPESQTQAEVSTEAEISAETAAPAPPTGPQSQIPEPSDPGN
jgi:preprotein translocase subunit SecG